jgi:hypothetical protein
MREFQRLHASFPERFAEVRDWEADRRANDPKRASYAILRDRSNNQSVPLPLADFEKRFADEGEIIPAGPVDDRYGCFCDV